MKKLSRRELFRGAGATAAGGAALAVGLKPTKAAPKLISLVDNGSDWTPETLLPSKIPIFFCSTATGLGPATMASVSAIMEWSLVNDSEV